MISLMVKEQLKLSKPVVCIDPSKEMLDMAERNGAITIHATAEKFLERKPQYPLKKVLIISCVHHFANRDSVFANLAKHMPDNGMCLIVNGSCEGVPFFKARKEYCCAPLHVEWAELCQELESKGLNCRVVSGTELVQCEKALWLECIRNRFVSSLRNFSDSKLEEGIKELEEELKDQDMVSFNKTFKGILVTKT